MAECKSSTFKNLKSLTKLERQNWLDSFDVAFCDCDGVIWQTFGECIQGAGGAINFLRNQGKKIAFVTNNSILPIEMQLKKLQSCGIDAKNNDIIHPAQTVCDYLKSENFDGLIFCMASTSFKQHLRNAGFKITEANNVVLSESVDELRAAIYSEENVKAVVIDVDFNLTAAKLMRAHVHLKQADCLFIGGAADEVIPLGGGDIIGAGPFINVVEQASKRKAVILGKPGKDLCDILKSRFELNKNPRRALFIGDSLTSDVRFAKTCGFQTLLVLSGGTSAADLLAPHSSDELPDYVANSLAELLE